MAQGFEGLVDGGGFVNATARFLAANWSTIRPHLLNIVNARFCAVRESGIAEDALSELAISLIKHDRLAPYINSGEGVQLGVLTVWALQRAANQMRCWGKDAGTRTMYGARTVMDRENKVEASVPGTEEEMLSLEDDDLTPEESASFRATLATVSRVAEGQMDPYILYLKAEGSERGEIAEELGWTEGQVAFRLRTFRQKLRVALSKQV